MLCYVAFALLGHLAVVTAQTPAPTPSAITLTANITSLQTNVGLPTYHTCLLVARHWLISQPSYEHN